LILDPDDRVLLVRFDWPDKHVWAPPGGGIDEGETPEQGIVRELAEECGLRDFDLGPVIWTRTHWHTDFKGWGGQTEQIYLVRTESFETAPEWTVEELATEGVSELRWFAQAELAQPDLIFAPRRLQELVADLVAHGPASEAIDVGV